MTKNQQLIAYTLGITTLSVVYFAYAWFSAPPLQERETFLSEVGEGLGNIAMWAILFIYARTLLKLIVGKGKLSERLIPEYAHQTTVSLWRQALRYLNKTHVHVGIATTAVVLLHIAFSGGMLSNLFFIAVLALILWQGVFGMFLRWKYSPVELKRFSYLVHAQFFTGITMGIFAWFGHMLID